MCTTGLFFGSCDSQYFYLFSWKEEEKEEGKEEKGKGEEREEGGERLVYRRLCISAGMGPLTLKLFASYRRFCEICAASNTRIHFSKSLVKHVLVYIVNLWCGAAKQEDICDTAKDTEHIMYVSSCIVKERRKLLSIHIFTNVLLAY